ncbi:glycine receptor subunit alpha-4-like isoform X2 [Ischnura elegans]|nr:glycine receptor subunit alpha-4-like isoform X2 [Ischnura elegans]XP_046400749.1 glycine receptor subunit alpha-4-like isoform X2 [Ischnura elegans]
MESTTSDDDYTSTIAMTTTGDDSTVRYEEPSLIKRNGINVNIPSLRPERHKFTELIPEDYSIHDPPPLIDGGPVPVKFSVSIKNIPDINELKQMISVEMNLRIYWQDTRLANAANSLFQGSKTNHSYLSLNPVALSSIWVPDIYTDYAKSVSNQRILSPPISLRIYPNATIRYSARIMMEMACPMEFRMYPADSQRCDLRLESYGFTREELYFSWVPEGKAVNIAHRLAHFDYAVNLIGEKGDVNFPSGSYPAISICIRFQRRMNYHLLQTYIPSGLFVVVSWLSFMVPRECAPGRLAICMTTLLTLTAMFGAVRQNTPTVSYIKALDIWMVGCIICVFFALAQFASVLRLDKQAKVKERKAKKTPSPTSKSACNGKGHSNWGCTNTNGLFRTLSPESEGDVKKWSPNSKEDSHSLDLRINDTEGSQSCQRRYEMSIEFLILVRKRIIAFCPLIAIGTFTVFNICYWPWILSAPSFGKECD